MTVGLETPAALAQRLAAVLGERGDKLAVAEGATGGALANLLTQVPGSSAWFRAGVVAYTDFPKQLVLRVSTETIQEQGAISAEATVQMARLARRLFNADWGVAITGYADDTAPTPDDKAQGVPGTTPPGAERIEEEKRGPQSGLTFLAVAGRVETPTEERPDTHTWEERLLAAPDRATYKEEASASAIELLLSVIEEPARARHLRVGKDRSEGSRPRNKAAAKRRTRAT
jgi:PncC family amidohydrolase